MSPNMPTYKQPVMYGYPDKGCPSNYHRKHSEGSALIKPIVTKSSLAFKQNCMNKKQGGRKRVFSTNETSFGFEHKFRQFSTNLSNTKDSSTSSTNKYVSPSQNGGSQEPKSVYLKHLRQLIKDKEDHNIGVSELVGHISEISQDQIGSRFIQRVYESAPLEDKNCKSTFGNL